MLRGIPSFENSHVGINFIENLWIGEARIHQKYGKTKIRYHFTEPKYGKTKKPLIMP